MSEVKTPTPYDNGVDAEFLVKKILIHDGWSVIDVNQQGSGAPLIDSPSDKRVLPDLIAINSKSELAFFEVKEKKDGPEPIIVHDCEWQHCIDESNYRDYIEISRRYNAPVYLCVLEIPKAWRCLLYGEISELETVENVVDDTEKDYGEEQVFFPRGTFNFVRKTYLDPVDGRMIYVEGTPLNVAPNPIIAVNENPSIDRSQMQLDSRLWREENGD